MTRGANIRDELSQVSLALEWEARGQSVNKGYSYKEVIVSFTNIL